MNQDTNTWQRKLLRAAGTPAGRALLSLAMVLALGMIFNADGAFFKIGTHRNALLEISVYGILACGMTLVIVSGGIDLSVGSVLALVAVVFSLTTMSWGWSAWLTVPMCLAVGACCGGVSGTLAAKLRIQPFVATLAMMIFARGLAKWVCNEQKVQAPWGIGPDGKGHLQYPDVFHALRSWVPGKDLKAIAVVTAVFLLCIAVTWVALSRHRWGRQLYAIGGNEEAARLSGIPVAWAKIAAYAASGLLAAVAGICQAGQDGLGNPETGATYELTAIAIVVIGGTNLMGGRGGIGLTLIGTLTIGYLEKILSINDVDDPVRQMLKGLIIVVAVLAQKRRR